MAGGAENMKNFYLDKKLVYSGVIAGFFFLSSTPFCMTGYDSVIVLLFSLFLFTIPLWINMDKIGVDE